MFFKKDESPGNSSGAGFDENLSEPVILKYFVDENYKHAGNLFTPFKTKIPKIR